jgi:hypothetical protein
MSHDPQSSLDDIFMQLMKQVDNMYELMATALLQAP